MANLRSLPRVFLEGASTDGPIQLPAAEVDKLRKVLRLGAGAEIAVLPNDGRLIRCEFRAREAWPIDVSIPDTEPNQVVRLAQALPKGEKLDEIVRSCTPIGVSEFLLFPGERTIVQWDASKMESRLARLKVIARESAELSFRTRLPRFSVAQDLAEVLRRFPTAIVLSEVEGISPRLQPAETETTVVVGPEGGWAPRELSLIGDRGVTLGPRVLRTEHAGAAAAAILLLR